MLLRLLLTIDEESVASFHHITKVSPKSRMSQFYVAIDRRRVDHAHRLRRQLAATAPQAHDLRETQQHGEPSVRQGNEIAFATEDGESY
ncbi:MAG TPA: hypothetical protein VFA10_18640 [Ktedonobacteraceae bacterium]|nr:hypothetical protein [Ktedonobacteraceae bacterium]